MSYETFEVGGSCVGDLMCRVGDVMFYGQSPDAARVSRMWSVYRDGDLATVKISLEWIDCRCLSSTHTTTVDKLLRFAPATCEEGEARETREEEHCPDLPSRQVRR